MPSQQDKVIKVNTNVVQLLTLPLSFRGGDGLCEEMRNKAEVMKNSTISFPIYLVNNQVICSDRD